MQVISSNIPNISRQNVGERIINGHQGTINNNGNSNEEPQEIVPFILAGLAVAALGKYLAEGDR